MTVLVGVHCQDGVIIGTDSAVTTAANVYQRTLQETGCLKIDVHFGEIITAVTGDIGLAQRFKYELETLLQGKQIEKFKSMSPVPYVTAIAHNTIENFKKTTSAQQHNLQFGWGLGGLVAFVAQDKPQLAEFSATQFHPELKGLTTSDGKPTNRPYVTMGGAQAMADPFIAHASRMLFGTNVPNLK
jgi:20S proteasome alpha/beta subunit